MKNILKNILTAILLISTFSFISHAQIKEVDEFMIKEDYLNDFEKVIIKPCCSGEEPSDLRFTFSRGVVLSNHDLIQLARERAINAWYRRQHDLMRREIGRRFNKSYPNFEQARNDYFKHWERKSILKAANNTRREFSTKVRRRSNFKEKKIRNLKLLDLRKREIDLGNINNSNFSSFKINDTPISSITSLSQLNSLRNKEVGAFGNNEYRLHNDRVIYNFVNNDIIGDIGLYSNRFNFNYPILNSILHLQINHYNTIGSGLPYHHSWYQLDLMQQYLNNVTYPVPQIPPRVSPRYFGHDDYIRRFALNQNRNNVSIFDPRYEEQVVHSLASGMSWEEFDINERDLSERAIVIIEREQKEYLNNLLENFDVFDQINDDQLTGKAKCIYNKLKNTSTEFKSIIQKFDGDFPVSHLTFEINDDLPNGNYGRTFPPSNYGIKIEFSNTQLGNISDLGAAVAFVHEIIHAEIFRKMLSAAQKGDLNVSEYTTEERVRYVNSLRNNFPGLYDYYWKRFKPTWNHNLMAKHYRTVIADAIQKFDNYRLSRQIYEDVSWVGLRILEDNMNSVAWNELNQSEKQRVIKNMRDYFKNGNSNCN